MDLNRREAGTRGRLRRSVVTVVMACALTACSGQQGQITASTSPVPATAEIVQRPTTFPPAPTHRLGYDNAKYWTQRAFTETGPKTGRSYALDAPAQRRALALADALGLAATPISFGANPWQAAQGTAKLEIWPDSGGRWRYRRQSTISGSATVDDRQARALARPVLRAAGLDPAGARADHSTAVLEPRVQGHPTWGWETEIHLDAKGVVYASGWLGPTRAETERALLAAAQAFTRLQQQAARPRKASKACPAVFRPHSPGCPPPTVPSLVTGARFAYALDWGLEGHRPRLVPAWLFTRQGVPAPAVFAA
ncbi:hypothetical protein [Actinomadura sp. 21ATH]|uniref:hypothetical protein n=1 Tax=Actinomadura sp. 21ATH TaxID=1735444 RepID=UPI0035C10E2A